MKKFLLRALDMFTQALFLGGVFLSTQTAPMLARYLEDFQPTLFWFVTVFILGLATCLVTGPLLYPFLSDLRYKHEIPLAKRLVRIVIYLAGLLVRIMPGLIIGSALFLFGVAAGSGYDEETATFFMIGGVTCIILFSLWGGYWGARARPLFGSLPPRDR